MTNEARDRVTTGNVIDFPPQDPRSPQESSETWLSADTAISGLTVDEIKSLFDVKIAKAIASSLQQGILVDNPFDAVYLSELQPDKLHSAIITRIDALTHIKDLSSTIHFNDGLDD